jgi:hypothetical protein
MHRLERGVVADGEIDTGARRLSCRDQAPIVGCEREANRKAHWPSSKLPSSTLAAANAGLAGKKPTANVQNAPLAICTKPYKPEAAAEHQPAAATHRLHDAREEQCADRRRAAGDSARRDVERERDEQGRPPPEFVGNRAVQQLTAGYAEQIEGDRQLDCAGGNSKVGRRERQGRDQNMHGQSAGRQPERRPQMPGKHRHR